MRAAPLALVVLLASCGADAVPIRYGGDSCAHCRMTISDTRFGAELVTDKGKPFTFDAIECLVAYLDAHPGLQTRAIWVTDFEQPPQFLPAQQALYVRSAELRSPMGANLAAFAPSSDRAQLGRRYGGAVLTWTELRRQLRESGQGADAGHTMMMPGR
ncbi:MAG TPA: nitrous oxide reductase accessory protein NosL [Longimicrobiales bacterium]